LNCPGQCPCFGFQKPVQATDDGAFVLHQLAVVQLDDAVGYGKITVVVRDDDDGFARRLSQFGQDLPVKNFLNCGSDPTPIRRKVKRTVFEIAVSSASRLRWPCERSIVESRRRGS